MKTRPRWTPLCARDRGLLEKYSDAFLAHPVRHMSAADDPSVQIAYRVVPPTVRPVASPAADAVVDDVAIVIIQGYNETMEKYAEVVHELQQGIASSSNFGCDTRATVFLMDLRNQGVSGRERELREDDCVRARFAFISDWRKWIHDLEDFITKVVRPAMSRQYQERHGTAMPHPTRICAVAHSTGCLITMHVAARHPDWFHSITLSSPFWRLKVHKRIFGNLDLFTLPFRFVASAFSIRTFFGQKVLPTKDMVLDEQHKMSHNRTRCEWWHEIRTTKNPSGCIALVMTWQWLNQAILCYSVLPTVLSQVTCPVAIVPADDEVLVSNEATYELASLLPDCTIIRPGTGCFHEIWMEDEVSRLLLRDVCVQNTVRMERKGISARTSSPSNIGAGRQWHGNVVEHIVYRSKGSSTLVQDRAHALRSVSLWRLAHVGVVAAWLLRFVMQRQLLFAKGQCRKRISAAVGALFLLGYLRKRLTQRKNWDGARSSH